jgi:hypothetical protein
MDPDPTTHLFPALDPLMLQNDPLRLLPFHFDADPYGIQLFTLTRIRIQLPKMMRIHADPDPQHRFWSRIQQIANSNQVQPYSMTAYEEYEQDRDSFAALSTGQLFLILGELRIRDQ